MSTGQQPVTPVVGQEHLDTVQAALRALSDAQHIIQKLENLGQDVSHYRTMSAHWDAKLRAIMKEFATKP